MTSGRGCGRAGVRRGEVEKLNPAECVDSGTQRVWKGM